ncbi:MAG: hypothetical protein Athens071416_547 [Parcubacteria group bacterium Athens0714_16]|nr:MAG: hypothetical protein Athens071416_547 [Parcubacteria group bacterium Athens0714_16]
MGDFNKLWLEIILSRGVLERKDVLYLLEKFEIKFTDKDWQNKTSIKEMGLVLTFEYSDTKNQKLLLEETKKIIEEKYSNLVNYNEGKKIFLLLIKLDENILTKLCIVFGKNKNYVEMLKKNKTKIGINKYDLIFNLFEEIYSCNK